jgi:hypothetical protein
MKVNVLSRGKCEYRRDLDWSLDTQPATTSNYNIIANFAFYKSVEVTLSLFSLLSLVVSWLTDPNNGDSSASVLTSLLSGEYPTNERN